MSGDTYYGPCTYSVKGNKNSTRYFSTSYLAQLAQQAVESIKQQHCHLDEEVLHREAENRRIMIRRYCIFFRLLVAAEDVDRRGNIIVLLSPVVVFAVEVEAIEDVPVVADLKHAILSVAALDDRIFVAGDGDGGIFCSVRACNAVVCVDTLVEIAGVAGQHHLQAHLIVTLSGVDIDSHG